MYFIPQPVKTTNFILNTVATNHVCYSQNFFTCLKRIYPITVKLPNGSLVTTEFAGTILFYSYFMLTHVLYIPKFSFYLISVTKLTHSLQCQLIFHHFTCVIHKSHNKKMIGTTDLRGFLYILNQPQVAIPLTLHLSNNVLVNSIICQHNTCNNYVYRHGNIHDTTCNIWNLSLDHPSHEKLLEIHKVFPFVQTVQNISPCDVCFYAKQKRFRFPYSNHKSVDIFDLVHMDMWSPLSIPSLHGHKYFLTVVDDTSIYTWIFLMKYKSEIAPLVKAFVSLVKTQFNKNIKCIRSDNGNDFLLKDFYRASGIIHHTSCVGTPQTK